MKKLILLLFMAFALTASAGTNDEPIPMRTHEDHKDHEVNRAPINLPIKVLFNSTDNTVSVWCDDDNIQAEIFIYEESGIMETYSQYMNVVLPITTTGTHSIIIKDDDSISVQDSWPT